MKDPPVAQWIAALRRLNLNDVRAKQRQKRSRKWTGNGLPQLKNFHARQRTWISVPYFIHAFLFVLDSPIDLKARRP